MRVPNRPTPTLLPPAWGAPRLEWWADLRAAIAADAARSYRMMLDEGWTEVAATEHLDTYAEWITGQVADAVAEGRVLGRWSS